jgi:hypothetical protein
MKCTVGVAIGMVALGGCGPSEFTVTTQRYDNARTGQNLPETILNTANVKPGSFGKLFTRQVDDEIYAQPLFLASKSPTGAPTTSCMSQP